MASKIKVLNIISSARSGSTIFGNVLGELDGFFFAGEVRNLWNKVLTENRDCGCGKPVKSCDLWSEIFRNAYNGFENIDPIKLRSLMDKYTRSRHLPLMMIPGSNMIFKENLSQFTESMEKLYASIQKVTQSKVIVDSSKSTAYNYILSLVPNIDLYTVHLIRDSRGVVFSRLKTKSFNAKNNNNGDEVFLQKKTPFVSSMVWNARNLSSEILQKNKKYYRVKYEDFVRKPKEIVNDILDFIEEESSLPFLGENEVLINPNHAVWGNPSRFNTGTVTLKQDEEWKINMKSSDKMLSTILTLPLLVRYGYSLKN